MTQTTAVQSGRVTTEGDTLYYEVRGSGVPLLLIPPAGGDGFQYSWIAERLAKDYQVITYDRRANARSSMNQPLNFEISQQSRDAAAVLRAVGENARQDAARSDARAFVLGNSSGAVIALDMAKTQPQAVRAVIAHEPPIPRLLPAKQAKKWQRFFANVYGVGYNISPYLAALRFMLGVQLPVGPLTQASKGVNEHHKTSPEPYLSDQDAIEVLVKHELLPVTNYLPDVEQIRANGVRVTVAVSAWGLAHKTWYVQAGQILARQLGGEAVTFPGHHGSFMDMPDQWAEAVRRVLSAQPQGPLL